MAGPFPNLSPEQRGVVHRLRHVSSCLLGNVWNDPHERDNVLFPNTWVLRTGLPQLEEHVASLKKHPPIPTGTPDPYQPPPAK